VTELINSKAGFYAEDAVVMTEDGYGLSVQIMEARSDPAVPRSSFVGTIIMQHGFLDASHTWVLNEANESLAFLAASAGYRVYLTNIRGNEYSTLVSPNAGSHDYYEFSYDEMIRYDAPALISFVQQHSGSPAVHWIGHSQGTLMMFGGLASGSVDPASLLSFHALAPIAFLGHQTSAMLTTLSEVPESVIRLVLGKGEVPDDSNNLVRYLLKLLPDLCAKVVREVCELPLFLVAGCNDEGDCDMPNWNMSRVPVYAAHVGGTSVQDLLHFLQATRATTVPYYDYGSAHANEQHYNASTPPVYDIASIAQLDLDIYLKLGGRDNFGDTLDVEHLAALLPSANLDVIPQFQHIDFVWGVDQITRQFYETILTELAASAGR
jgi:pimeloyl-ACP methyl ester carboxylesterase